MLSAQLLQQGHLDACQTELFREIRKDPSNPDLRVFLFQLSCVQQDWPRARNQLSVLRSMCERFVPMVDTYTPLINAEDIRSAVLRGKEQPTCLGESQQWLADFHQAQCMAGLGDYQNAKDAALRGMEAAKAVSGEVDGQAFSWLCDGDTRFGPAFEVMLQGNYKSLPFEYIERIDFEEVEDLRDMVWRAATVTLKDNAKLIVFIPTCYPLSDATTDSQKLARTSTWKEAIPDFFMGEGQRVLMSDTQEFGLLDIQCITFD
jgi:type VI secretion system protein ImpE